MGPFHLRIDGCDTHTSGHKKQTHLSLFLLWGGDQLAGAAEGTHNGKEPVALVEEAEVACTVAHNLIDDVDALVLWVDVADGQRHALSLVVGNDDDELPGHPPLCYPGRSDFHQINLVTV